MSDNKTTRCETCRWWRDLGEPRLEWGRCTMTVRQLRLRDDQCGQFESNTNAE